MQELAVDLNEMGSLKLSITVHWKPFVGWEMKPINANLLSDMAGRLTGTMDPLRDLDVVSIFKDLAKQIC